MQPIEFNWNYLHDQNTKKVKNDSKTLTLKNRHILPYIFSSISSFGCQFYLRYFNCASGFLRSYREIEHRHLFNSLKYQNQSNLKICLKKKLIQIFSLYERFSISMANFFVFGFLINPMDSICPVGPLKFIQLIKIPKTIGFQFFVKKICSHFMY